MKGGRYEQAGTQENRDGTERRPLLPGASAAGFRPRRGARAARRRHRRLEELAAGQIGGALARHSSAVWRKRIRRTLREGLLRHLATVAAEAAVDHRELTGMFRIPPSAAGNQAFQTIAHRMLDQGVAQKELLLRYGLSERLLADLAIAVAELDASIEETTRGLQEHVAAAAGLKVTTDEVMRVIRTIDGIHRHLFQHEPQLLAAWASARHVVVERRAEGEHEGAAGGGAPPREEDAGEAKSAA